MIVPPLRTVHYLYVGVEDLEGVRSMNIFLIESEGDTQLSQYLRGYPEGGIKYKNM